VRGHVRQISFSQFIDLIQNPLCTFIQSVRCLSFEGPTHRSPWDSWVALTLRDYINFFPEMHTLRMSFLDSFSPAWKSLTTPHPTFTHLITTLQLHKIEFLSLEQIFTTISKFANLVNLQWQSFYDVSENEGAALESSSSILRTYGQVPASLRVVELQSHASNRLVYQWLLDCRATCLNTMKIGNVHQDDVEVIARVLSMLGSSLEVFQMNSRTTKEMRRYNGVFHWPRFH